MFSRLRKIGPGAMVAAAFIGPGTVTTATLAGAKYGYTLLWAVFFSIVATMVLQEMSARLGITGGLGLGEAIREKVSPGLNRILASVLVLGAILVGNAAYEAGNLTGAVLGFLPIIELESYLINPLIPMIGLVAFLLLYHGKYQLIERSLIVMVSVMGVVFILAAACSGADFSEILRGFFLPSVPEGGFIMVVGIIGTTVVPYNLFLHASSVREKWQSVDHLPDARFDAFFSILIGGIITAAIIIAAAAVFTNQSITGPAELAVPLQPLLGQGAEFFVGIGFLAAGLSSSVTAPLAAAYATAGILGWTADLKAFTFRAIWMIVLVTGMVLASIGFKPLKVILFAQVANGILLPVIATFLLWTMNDSKIMGSHANTIVRNILGVFVLLVTVLIGLKSIVTAVW